MNHLLLPAEYLDAVHFKHRHHESGLITFEHLGFRYVEQSSTERSLMGSHRNWPYDSMLLYIHEAALSETPPLLRTVARDVIK